MSYRNRNLRLDCFYSEYFCSIIYHNYPKFVFVLFKLTIFSIQIKLPDSVDVRLLPEGDPFELHFKWKTQLLSFLLFLSGGSTGEITWGVLPADTGKRNDPGKSVKLKIHKILDLK